MISLEMQGLLQTREEIIEIQHRILALERKAQCRGVRCTIISVLSDLSMKAEEIDYKLTEIIGD